MPSPFLLPEPFRPPLPGSERREETEAPSGWLAARAGSSPSPCARQAGPRRRKPQPRAPGERREAKPSAAQAPRAFERSPSRSSGQRKKAARFRLPFGVHPTSAGASTGASWKRPGRRSRKGLEPRGLLLPRCFGGTLPHSKPQAAGEILTSASESVLHVLSGRGRERRGEEDKAETELESRAIPSARGEFQRHRASAPTWWRRGDPATLVPSTHRPGQKDSCCPERPGMAPTACQTRHRSRRPPG